MENNVPASGNPDPPRDQKKRQEGPRSSEDEVSKQMEENDGDESVIVREHSEVERRKNVHGRVYNNI